MMDVDRPSDDFTLQMRKKTSEVHNLSDALVQSKFVIGLIDDKVWAEGLLVFYEVFRFLEDCMERLQGTNVGKFFNCELLRSQYFEADLELYYGSRWREESPRRACVQNYISHLEQLEKENTDMLIAYIYHLFLGLLSGGRILRKKQKLMLFSKFSKRSSVVDFDNEVLGRLKKFIKETTNMIVQDMNDEKKNELLEESITVFKLNCDLIRSVNSANLVVTKIMKVFSIISIVAVVSICYYVYFKNNDESEL